MRLAKRLNGLPPYLFADLNRRLNEQMDQGVDVINLAAGDPDLAPLPHVLEALDKAIKDPAQHRYPPYDGLYTLKEAGARYYKRRFGVDLDPHKEVLVLIGAKEGLAHAAHALLEPGATALIPDPGYPVYSIQTHLAGGAVCRVRLKSEKDWLLPFDEDEIDATNARLLYLNYPANPTGATCDLAHLEAAVAFCRKHDIALVHDLAYGEITFDGYIAPSILQVPGAKDVAIEINSLSKTYRMAGMRIGFAVGNPALVDAIRILKSHSDTGQFRAIQQAAIAALDGPQDHLPHDRDLYQARRDCVVQSVRKLGLTCDSPRGSLYVWAKLPSNQQSLPFALWALEIAGVLMTPGVGYGAGGEGYVRIALTTPEPRIEEAMVRLAKALP